MGVAVAPDDVAADHRCLLSVRAVVGAVEREVAQRLELGLDPIQPRRVRRRVGELDVVRSRPLADTLIDDYDVVDLLQDLVETCRDVLDTTAAGILLADSRGELELVASTSEASRLVEMMQLSAEKGPCIESYRSGRRVSVPDIGASKDEWWQFRGSALAQGFQSIDALPLRLRDAKMLKSNPAKIIAEAADWRFLNEVRRELGG